MGLDKERVLAHTMQLGSPAMWIGGLGHSLDVILSFGQLIRILKRHVGPQNLWSSVEQRKLVIKIFWVMISPATNN